MSSDSSVATERRYTIISSDCHAGGNMAMYTEYLDPKWMDEFEAWRGRYSNPFRDLQDNSKARNWDDERRISEMEADGVVGEISFPNTVPPFFPTGQLIAYPPRDRADYDRRLAGIRAHNRWLKDWVAGHPDRRRGLAQIFVNDIDDAITDVRWAADNGFKSVMLPSIPPDLGVEGYFNPVWDPLWQVFEENNLTITMHGGNGTPDYGDAPAASLMFMMEVPFFANRNLWQFIMSGVFERFPTLKFVMTEQGTSWAVDALRRMDAFHREMSSGRVGEMGFAAELVLKMTPSEYFDRNVWIGSSFPSPLEAEAGRSLGVHKIMWGTDYPHVEGTYPFTREALRRCYSDWAPADLDKIFSENAAYVYDFDLPKLQSMAESCGPTVGEIATPLDAIPKGATSPAFFRA